MFALIRVSNRNFTVYLATLLLCGQLAAQQMATPHEPHDRVGPVHLVGHEETALLQRVQDVIDDWDPRKLTNPYVKTHVRQLPNGPVVEKLLKRPDLAEFIADVEAAEVLGKAFAWDMQAGSDFRRNADGKYIGTACASCHYSAGADARNRGVMRIPTVVWDKYTLDKDHQLEFGEKQREYNARLEATRVLQSSLFPKGTPLSLIVGSPGVAPNRFQKLNGGPTAGSGPWNSEEFTERKVQSGTEQWAMFVADSFRGRQVTHRNSPSIINSGFSNRLFHDGRAESTFNGFSIFGDADPREVIHRRRDFPKKDSAGKVILKSDGSPEMEHDIIHVSVAITNAALASQAVGPIVNDVEMSYSGREFPDVARKLLDAEILDFQTIDATDSLFAPFDARIVREQLGCGIEKENLKRLVGADRNSPSYRELIQRAFRKEWWDSDKKVELILSKSSERDGSPEGELMEANFSLFWGVSIMLYEASLVSNQSPFDDMMQGRNTLVEKKWEDNRARLGAIHLDRFPRPTQPEHETGTAVFQHGFRIFMNQGCIECHSGPLFSEIYERKMDLEKSPIHHTIERVLLPNSQSESIAIEKQKAHKANLEKIGGVIRAKHPELVRNAANMALELDLLRENAAGSLSKLSSEVVNYLKPFPTTKDLVQPISDLLLEFDRRSKLPFGNRSFFGEAERVDLAEAISDPVLVERMVIPPKLQQFRRPFPLADNPIANTYAFYDLGFYNIGVSPPRYDSGIGEASSEEVESIEERETIEKVSTKLSGSLAKDEQELGKKLQSGLLDVGRQIIENKQSLDSPAKVLDQVLNDVKSSFTEQEKVEIRALIAQMGRTDRRPTATPGSAYQFRSDWYGDRFKSKLKSQSKKEGAETQPIPNAIDPARTSNDGQKEDANQNKAVAEADKTWDRDGLPLNARRSQLYFKSRARRLVSNELKWGFRKPFSHDNELAFWGAFKTPSLRNVELTAPYMHNGRLLTLSNVISFYEHDIADKEEDMDDGTKPNRHGHDTRVRFVPRDRQSNPDKHPAIVPLDFTRDDRLALEFFLICLTDERVKYEQAPFDHPSLEVVDGYLEESGVLKESFKHVNATGALGIK